MAQNTFEQLYKDNRLWFGSEGKNRPRLKNFYQNQKDNDLGHGGIINLHHIISK